MFSAEPFFSPMGPADLPEVLAIEQAAYPYPWTEEQFRQELANPVSRIDLARSEGELCGYICYWLIAGEMQILNVATAPQWRRQGIGGRLLTKALQNCQRQGLSTAWLEVRKTNSAAIALYQQHGFRVESCRKGYYRDGEDALLMVRGFATGSQK